MQKHEIDERTQKLTDSEIMLNFAQAIDSIYPYMKNVFAHCYDAYDDIVESLFYSMVYQSFFWKYGVEFSNAECATYDYVGSIRALAHVRVIPKRLPLIGLRDGQQFEITSEFIQNNTLLFKTFGDGVHNLTDSEVENDSHDIAFNFTEIDACNNENQRGLNFIWIQNDLLDYQFYYTDHLENMETKVQKAKPWWKFW